MGLYVTIMYTGEWSGEEPLHETVWNTTGELFRSMTGRDHSRPWERLGRCIGRAYIDDEAGRARQCGWVFVRRMRDEDGRMSRCESWVSVYTAPPDITVKHHPAEFGR